MATEKGNRASCSGGTFQLVCTKVSYTDSAIKFYPSVAILDAFNKKVTITVEYQNPAGNWVTVLKGSGKSAMTVTSSKGLVSNTDYKTQVRAKVGSTISKLTLTNNIKPATPTILATYLSDGRIQLNITTGYKGSAVPNNTIHVYRKTDAESEYTEIAPMSAQGITGSMTYTYYDYDVSAGHRYKYAAAISNQAGTSGRTKEQDWVYTAPAPVSNVSAERIDDYHTNVSFEVDVGPRALGTITHAIILRSLNGSRYMEIARIPLHDSDPRLYTWTDDSNLRNAYYRYGIKAANDQRVSVDMEPLAGTDTMYGTPAPPYGVEVHRTSSGGVSIYINNFNVRTAEKTQIQKNIDGDWVDVAEIDFEEETGYVDLEGAPDHTYYRVRNTRDDGELVSGWSTCKEWVMPPQKPDPPTILYPYPNTMFNSGDTARIEWHHNSRDNSEQEEATISISVNGEQASTVIISGSETYYDLSLTGLGVNAIDEIAIKIMTKGAAASYSEYCDPVKIYVASEPELTIYEPTSSTVIETLPLHFDVDYTDITSQEHGPETLQMIIYDGENEVYKKDLDVASIIDPSHDYHMIFDFTDFLFDNNKQYTIQLNATGYTGLTTTSQIMVSISYDNVSFTRPWYPDLVVNEDTGIVTVTINKATEDMEPDPDDPTQYLDEDVVGATLYRVSGNDRVKVADGLTEGSQVVDYYAPLNQLYTYELVLVSEHGSVSLMTQDAQVLTPYWYVYWGDNNEHVCRALYNPAGDVQLSRPEKELIRYSGRSYPVSYDSTAVEETFAYTGVVVDREELNNFIRMIRNGGLGVWHSANGEAYKASFDFDYNADYTRPTIRWDVKLSVTRIEG